MAVSDVARAASDLLSNLPRVHLDAGYALALAGMVILLIFGVALVGLITYRAIKAVANMTPEKFVILTAVLAGVLIIIGSLLP